MRIFLLAVLAMAWVASAWADVRLTVWAGAGGTVRSGATTPVIVLVENDERDRSGVLRVGFTDGAFPLTWAAQALELPPGARKRVFMYLPLPGFSDRVVVRYETPGGRRIAVYEERLNVVAGGTRMVASVGEWPRGLPDADVGNFQRYRSVQLLPDLLPGRFEGLEMYDVVLITPPPEKALEAEQVGALADWVLRGGTLIVDASERTDGLQHPAFRELLPFVPVGIEEGALEGFEHPIPYATGSVVEGKVLLSANGHPLVVRRNFGLGSIVAFAFEPGDSALLAADAQDALWRDVLGVLEFDPPEGEIWPGAFGTGVNTVLMNSVAGQGHTPLRLGLVVLLTLLYALAVGPGDYYLVKWLGRPRLTWVTFPLMALGFSVAAYGGARLWFGGETTSTSFRRQVAFPELDRSVALDVTNLFAGQGGDYELWHAENARLRNLQPSAELEKAHTIENESGHILQRIPVWTQRVYAGGHTLEECPDVELSLQKGPDGPQVFVENKSGLRLEDCHLLTSAGKGMCPEVAAGKNALVDVTLAVDPHRPYAREGSASPNGEFVVEWEDEVYQMTNVLPSRPDVPFARELFVKDALRRGAVVLRAKAAPAPPGPLIVNGHRRSERAKLELVVVTYEGER